MMPWYLKFALGIGLAIFVATVSAFLADYWDPSFRTPLEVEAMLDLPVLAAIPHPGALPESIDPQPRYPLAS
jgi:capsular polysaccharide biosynthesis protein